MGRQPTFSEASRSLREAWQVRTSIGAGPGSGARGWSLPGASFPWRAARLAAEGEGRQNAWFFRGVLTETLDNLLGRVQPVEQTFLALFFFPFLSDRSQL